MSRNIPSRDDAQTFGDCDVWNRFLPRSRGTVQPGIEWFLAVRTGWKFDVQSLVVQTLAVELPPVAHLRTLSPIFDSATQPEVLKKYNQIQSLEILTDFQQISHPQTILFEGQVPLTVFTIWLPADRVVGMVPGYNDPR